MRNGYKRLRIGHFRPMVCACSIGIPDEQGFVRRPETHAMQQPQGERHAAAPRRLRARATGRGVPGQTGCMPAVITAAEWRAGAGRVAGRGPSRGDEAGYRGVVKPSRLFVAAGEGRGAWERVGRYGVAEVGDAAFPSFADAATSARRAGAWRSGATGFLASTLKLVVNSSQARFDGGAVAGAGREGEKTLFSRVQVSF